MTVGGMEGKNSRSTTRREEAADKTDENEEENVGLPKKKKIHV